MSERNDPPKLWLYAPGEGAAQWELYKTNNVAGIGYNIPGLEALDQYETEEKAAADPYLVATTRLC